MLCLRERLGAPRDPPWTPQGPGNQIFDDFGPPGTPRDRFGPDFRPFLDHFWSDFCMFFGRFSKCILALNFGPLLGTFCIFLVQKCNLLQKWKPSKMQYVLRFLMIFEVGHRPVPSTKCIETYQNRVLFRTRILTRI